ncbi:MAG: sulfurtransferase [Gammaproteobacteria bacterium]|nr:sulfurtransferase [Gammaproteobacteria bacterium]
MQKIRLTFIAGILLWLSLCASSALLAQSEQSVPWSPLLDVRALAGMLESQSRSPAVNDASALRVVHVTGDQSAGVIPGAVFVPYSEFRGPAHNAGQLPALQTLQELVQKLGIESHTPVVIVHQGSTASDFGAATRVYWTLKSLGVQQLAVLNGGFQQWQAAGLPVSLQTATVPASDFTPVWHDNWRMATPQVEQVLQSDNARLIDSRPSSFYLGDQAVAARPGTIQGAVSLSFETWFDGSLLKPLHELQPLLNRSAVLDASPTTTVAFCNTGHWASINWFVLSELLNVPDTRLYAESVVEWAQQARPMDNQPGRLRWYWDMTRKWLNQITGF